MAHTTRLTVRSYEIDINNHVNNAVYLNYLEFARMDFLRAADFRYEAFRTAGYGVVVARISIDYRRPAFLHDELEIRTTPVKRKRAYGVFRQEVLKNGEIIAEAEVTWAVINSDGRPCPMPKEFDSCVFDPEA